jgi:hypothetical protein
VPRNEDSPRRWTVADIGCLEGYGKEYGQQALEFVVSKIKA